MNRYMESLSVNHDLKKRKHDDWELFKKERLPYDDTLPYFSYVVDQEILLDKKSVKPNGADYIREWLALSLRDTYEVSQKDDEFVKLKYYNWWVGNHYSDFSKNWNPDKVQDEGLNFMMITFNFSPKINIEQIKADMSRIFNLPVLHACKITYSYEFYTAGKNHPHVHALVEMNRTGTIASAKFREKVFQMKKLNEYLSVDFKFSWATNYDRRCRKRSECRAYVSGLKAESKSENCEADKLWRIENGLNPIYEIVNK